MEAMTGVSRIAAVLGRSRGQSGGKFFLSCSSADRADRADRETKGPLHSWHRSPNDSASIDPAAALPKPRHDPKINGSQDQAKRSQTFHRALLPQLAVCTTHEFVRPNSSLSLSGPAPAPLSAIAESRIGIPITDEA